MVLDSVADEPADGARVDEALRVLALALGVEVDHAVAAELHLHVLMAARFEDIYD